MKPLNYAIARDTRLYKVFKHIGIEPSGMAFNEMALAGRGQTGTAAFGPLINAGTCALPSRRVNGVRGWMVLSYWRRLWVGNPCNIDEDMYRSESATAN